MGPPRDGESWQYWLARRARAYRRSLLAHRDGARVVVGAGTLGPEALTIFAEELEAMVARGFTPALALRTIATISQYVNGFVLQEQSHSPGTPAAPPPEIPSVMLAAVTAGANPTGEETFEHGLRCLIDGTETALNRLG